ncbi:MAG TPA: N-6 DNA methylase, partial [Ignavibacteria bacterium]
MIDIQTHILDYLRKVKAANKEAIKKEIFKDLLNRLYAHDIGIEKIIDKITLGAEQTVLSIPRKEVFHRGSADTLYNKIIIEFENNLKVSGKHAKEQLAGYLLGQFNSGEGYNFTLISSDFIDWKVFSPDISCLDKLDTLNENELILNEIESSSFSLNEHNLEEFYFWIDRFLFKEEKQRATLKRIEEAFGYQSSVFIESFRELRIWFNEAKEQSEVQVSFEQWSKFLSIAYSSFNASEDKFLIHTYLSVFSKLLAYEIVSKDDFIDDDEMRAILDGSIFYSYNISNFVDNDFFHWVNTDKNFINLKKVLRLLTQEISVFDFENVDEDVLKGVYQELIDLDTRHSLGEYYTPDWLCERIVNEFNFVSSDKILDPACGSGSFLRAVIHNIRKNNPAVEAYDINNQIYGIDIHPLSVQIAKTTMLLALGKEVIKSKKTVHLNIILANTLLAPEGVQTLWGNQFSMPIDKNKYILNTQIFENGGLFDDGLEVCEKLSQQTMGKTNTTIQNFGKILSAKHKSGGLNSQITESFYNIYLGFKDVKEKGRNSIWKFIVQNLYKPYFLSKKFNYVIGNPPWFTYSSIQNEEYQNVLNALAIKYDLKPSKIADYPHLEIAAIFLAHCNNYFLHDDGKVAFVLPRSFFNGSQHDNSRSGKAKGFKITNIWDLNGISPLFNIPSCVLFTEKAYVGRALPASGLKGLSLTGRLPVHNCNYIEAEPKIIENQVTWFYAKQGKATAFSNHKSQKQNSVNPYKKLFKQGATIVPRTFYFIELNQGVP